MNRLHSTVVLALVFSLGSTIPSHSFANGGSLGPSGSVTPVSSAGGWFLPKIVPPDGPVARTPVPGQPEGGGSGAGSGGSSGARPFLDGSGWTFAPNVRPHPETTGQHLWPDIARAPDGTVSVAWMDDHAAGGYHIFYSASTDEGETWSTPERVDDRTTGDQSKFVSLAVTPSGRAVAVWEDNRTGAINLYFSIRTGVNQWSPNVKVNTAGGPPSDEDYMDGSITVVDEQRYFVAWTDWREGVYTQVYMRGTRDGGKTWTPETRISDEIGYEPLAGDPCLISDPASGGPGAEILYCVMNDWRGYAPGGRYPEVYFSGSTNGGATWSDGVVVNDIHDYFQQVASKVMVRRQDGGITVGWYDDSYYGPSFRTSVSTDRGVTWGPSARVDDPLLGGTGTYPAIGGFGNTIFACWDAPGSGGDAYFRESLDGGLSWTEPEVRMDDDTTGASTTNPVLVGASGDQVTAAWEDTRPGFSNWEIYTSTGTRNPASVGSESIAAAPSVLCYPNPSRIGEDVTILIGRDGTSASSPGGATNGGRGIGAAGSGDATAGTGTSTAGWIGLFDASGRLVRILSASGAGPVRWDGRDASGRAMAAGAYWVKFPGLPASRMVQVTRIR